MTVGKMVFDEIGYWSELKQDIVREYSVAYCKILAAQPYLTHVYIDAFAGPGESISRSSGEVVPGSPLNALDVEPKFSEYYFIEKDPARAEILHKLTVDHPGRVHILEGDCNEVLLDNVFPQVHWEDYRRGLCLLDPYGLTLDWRVIKMAGQLRTIDLILNFPVMDMNRNVFWRNPEGVDEADLARMNRFWGDESWREVVYDSRGDLFGHLEKQDNEIIAAAFQKRLEQVAGFPCVARPIPMRNSRRTVVYYLFLASQKSVAADIASYIFDKYRNRT